VPDPGEVTSGQVGIDELAQILVAYPRGIDMAALGPLPAEDPPTGDPATG
jgi:hypothetical protein